VNAALKAALLHSPAARSLLSAPSADAAAHPYGEVVLVDYGSRATDLIATGLGHGMYTRLDAMLFHAELVATRLYPSPRVAQETTRSDLPRSTSLWLPVR
jgi:hypothetical protein